MEGGTQARDSPFVDLVDSSSLVVSSDPEVVRRRVNRYFEPPVRLDDADGARRRAGRAGRDDEAEQLLRDAVDAFVESGHRFAELQALEELSRFLRDRGRDEEAALYEERAFALAPVSASTQRIA